MRWSLPRLRLPTRLTWPALVCAALVDHSINTAPLSDVLKEHDIDMPIPMNRQNLTGVPFIFPGLAALLGLIGACPCARRLHHLCPSSSHPLPPAGVRQLPCAAAPRRAAGSVSRRACRAA